MSFGVVVTMPVTCLSIVLGMFLFSWELPAKVFPLAPPIHKNNANAMRIKEEGDFLFLLVIIIELLGSSFCRGGIGENLQMVCHPERPRSPEVP